MKFKIILILLISLTLTSCVRPYIEGGLMIHTQQWAEPEVEFPSKNLGYAEIGVDKQEWHVFVKHISDPSTFEEEGHGINAIGVSKKLYLWNDEASN